MTSRIKNPDTGADIDLQKAIVEKSSFVMIAGAGSGKTTSLVKGLKYIKDSVGVTLLRQKQKVACITYTTVAENEIKNDVNEDPLFQVSTVHSFLWELIKPFQSDIKVWVKMRIDIKLAKLNETKSNFGPRVQQRTKEKNQAEIDELTTLKANIDKVNHFRYETGSDYGEGILGHDDIIKMVPFLINEKPLLRVILINKYPFVFVDESQDTLSEVVSCLSLVDQEHKEKFCLGFFGDPMQKIYTTGIGIIPIQPQWKEIIKPQNFRSPTRVLNVINNIRKSGDGIQQKGGKREIVDGKEKFIEGTASLFVLPTMEAREGEISRVRRFIADKYSDSLWIEDNENSDLKILVIEHRMAAKRLNFEGLFNVFKTPGNESAYTSFSEGRHWSLKPFLNFILPLIKAYEENLQSNIMSLLRLNYPLFEKNYLKKNKSEAPKIFAKIIELLKDLRNKFSKESENTFRDIFEFIRQNELLTLDERIIARLDNHVSADVEESTSTDRLLDNLFNCPIIEIFGYQKYIEDESVYSTQHSIKGSEFDRVLVVLDDEEGANSTLYSYEKLFGIKEMSERDQQNIAEGNDSVLDRTRRLLYVCCSRAKKDLVVILFTDQSEMAYEELIKTNFFPRDSVYKLSDI